MKKILSLCLVICLICMASVSASAAENLKICGESYSIFQVAYLRQLQQRI